MVQPIARAFTAIVAISLAACGVSGPSPAVDLAGSWSGPLHYVSCEKTDPCFSKACSWEADFAYHTTATAALIVRQSGGSVAAELTIDERNEFVHYRETGRLTGTAGDELELSGSATRVMDPPDDSPFARPVEQRVFLRGRLASPGGESRLTATLARRVPASRAADACAITTYWSFESAGQPARP